MCVCLLVVHFALLPAAGNSCVRSNGACLPHHGESQCQFRTFRFSDIFYSKHFLSNMTVNCCETVSQNLVLTHVLIFLLAVIRAFVSFCQVLELQCFKCDVFSSAHSHWLCSLAVKRCTSASATRPNRALLCFACGRSISRLLCALVSDGFLLDCHFPLQYEPWY